MRRAPARALLAAILAALALAGCATTPPTQSAARAVVSSAQAAVRWGDFLRFEKADAVLDRAIRLLETASPGSLADAAQLLASPDVKAAGGIAAAASKAADAGSLGNALFQQIYPELSNPFPPGTPAQTAQAAGLSPFFSRVLPGLALLDPTTTVDDAQEADMRAGLSAAAAMNPDSALPSYLQGLLTLRRGGPASDARAQFEEALRRLPGFYPAGRELADIIIRGGTAANELPRLEQLASLLPTAPARFAALARAALAAGKPEQAADAAAQGLLVAPDDPSFVLLRAEALEAQGNWYQSLWIIDALLKVKPDESDAMLMKARLLYEKGENSAEALQVLTEAEQKFPTDASFPELQGRILLSNGRSDEGVVALTQSLTLSPGRVTVLSLLLHEAARAQKWDDAASWLAQIPEQSRSPDDLRMGWRTAMGLGDFAQALAHARALEKKGGGPDAMALEARALVAAGQQAQALSVVDAALPQAGEAALRSELYVIRSTAGSEDPLRDLRSALREEPDNGEALAAIADALAAQQEYRKAMEYARHAAELAPDNAQLVQKASDLEKRAAAEE
ncbi:MAG: tetratricopeptide repeat protein [Spirochaetia bacterium]|jgi:Flp pilus assembly protein TadD